MRRRARSDARAPGSGGETLERPSRSRARRTSRSPSARAGEARSTVGAPLCSVVTGAGGAAEIRGTVGGSTAGSACSSEMSSTGTDGDATALGTGATRSGGGVRSGIIGGGVGESAASLARSARSTIDLPRASRRVKRISSPGGRPSLDSIRWPTTFPSPRKSAVPSRSAISKRTISPEGRGPAPTRTIPPLPSAWPSPATNSSSLAYGRFSRNAGGGAGGGGIVTGLRA